MDHEFCLSLLQPKRIHLDLIRQWPPVTSCSFTHNLTSVCYQGPTTSAGTGTQETSSQPKGVMVYANSSIPAQVGGACHFCLVLGRFMNTIHIDPSVQAPSFYWELEVCHLGDSSSDAAHIAMGYSPEPQKPANDQPWAYPQETCLIRR